MDSSPHRVTCTHWLATPENVACTHWQQLMYTPLTLWYACSGNTVVCAPFSMACTRWQRKVCTFRSAACTRWQHLSKRSGLQFAEDAAHDAAAHIAAICW
mmetsp:Transcript_25830/g.66577  ORF Transcript_25830/g.66577 Transcript_25830/m.66577 type:complete len:100 (-) Transcript_25830:145-444(-)